MVTVPNARILIVEDHPTMREAMRLVLEGEGFVIGEAPDGQRALEMMRADPPDPAFAKKSRQRPIGEARAPDGPRESFGPRQECEP